MRNRIVAIPSQTNQISTKQTSKSVPDDGQAYILGMSAFSAVSGATIATVFTHPLNNFYTLMVTSVPGTIKKAAELVKQTPSILIQGFPETLALRSLSQGGALGMTSYLTHFGIDPINAAALGGIYDAGICSIIDLINVRKVTAQGALKYKESFNLWLR